MRRDQRDFLNSVAAISWRDLEGAYGSAACVADALRVLATEDDVDSDAWSDAMDDALLAHVWHQGDIFPVTPVALPFLFQLVDLTDVARPVDMARAIAFIAAAAARYLASDAPAKVELGQRVASCVEDQLASLERWLTDDELAEAALFIGVRLGPARPWLLHSLERAPGLSWKALVALAEIDTPPAWVIERAEAALVASDAETQEQIAAAALLARRGRPGPDLAARIDAALPPDAKAYLTALLELPFEVVIERPAAAFAGTIQPATVLRSGPRLVVAKLDGGGNVVLCWPSSGLITGDRIGVGLSVRGLVRVAERVRPDGSTERVELELPTPDPRPTED